MSFSIRGLRVDPKNQSNEFRENPVPNLTSLCKEIVLQKLVGQVDRNKDRTVWKSPAMTKAKSALNNILPNTVLEELYRQLFGINPSKRVSLCSHVVKRPSQLQFDWKETLSNFNGKKFFALWWLFLDEEYTKKLEVSGFVFFDGNFNLELIGFLSDQPTALTSINLSYNWILKADYLKVFKKQIHLRHLTLYGEINDSFLDLIGEHLSLSSLTFCEDATFQRTTVRKFVNFLDTQSECLEELSWNASDSLFQLNSIWSKNSNDVLKSIVRLRRLTRLHLHSHWIKYLDVTRSLSKLQHLTLHSAKVHHFSKMKVETFPSLKSLSLNLIVGEDDDLSPIAEFCASNPKTKISSIQAVVFNVHPLKLLSNSPTVISASLKFAKRETAGSNPNSFNPIAPIEIRSPYLTDLRIEAADYFMAFEDFKLIWSSFPALTKLTVYLNGVSNFVETDFVDFIDRQKSNLSNIRLIDIRLSDKNVGSMTGRSLLAILRSSSNLESFENFLYFPMSNNDRIELITLAEEMGATVLRAKRIGSVWCSEGDHFDFD